MSRIEKSVVGGLCVLGILMFFFPILAMNAPIVGTKTLSGYDVITNAKKVTENITRESETNTSDGGDVRLPVSLRFAFLVSLWVAAAFVTLLLTLVGVFWRPRLAKLSGTIGLVCGVFAILQLKMMNSDLHRLMTEVIGEYQTGTDEDALSRAFEGLTEMMVAAVNMGPGTGLYILTACLAAIAFLLHTRLLARLRLETPATGD